MIDNFGEKNTAFWAKQFPPPLEKEPLDEFLSVLPSSKSSQSQGCLGLGGVNLPNSGFI